jgi:uncharacterized protein
VAEHPIVHVEIPARDSEAAGQFYAQVFNWQLDNSAPNYLQFRTEGGPAGGFVSPGKAGDTSLEYKIGEVLIYLDSDDIDATLANVEAHGGTTVVPRTEIEGHGWWAVFTDPSGNKIGLYGR